MVKVVRKRDIAILAVVALTLYLSTDTTTYNYNLEPAWYFDQERTSFQWKSLPPIITDLDGDGRNEVIFITKDLNLKVMNAERPHQILSGTEEVYTPVRDRSVDLGSAHLGGIRKGAVPVAIKTGYIDEYDGSARRQQVIVIIREDWTVSCYSSKLDLLWERGISHQKAHDLENILEKYEMVEASIMTSPLYNGTIFVGTRVRLNDDTATNIRIEGVDGMLHDGNKEHPDLKMRSTLEHFGVHALDGKTGKILWLHDGTEQASEDFSKSLPMHAFRQEARDLMRQVHKTTNGNNWRVFKSSLSSELPHVWNDGQDSTFRLAHFVRKHLGAGAVSQKSAKKNALSSPKKKTVSKDQVVGSVKKPLGKLVSGKGRFLGVELPPVPLNAGLPHDASEHTDHPNVLVAHTRYGVEVFALKGGDSVTAVSLPEGRVSGDVDGDGIFDTVLVLENDNDIANHGSAFAHVGKKLERCTLMVVSGLPPTMQLFNGSLCRLHWALQDGILDRRTDGGKFPPVSATTPILLREHDPSSLSESKHKLVCAAVNTGTLSCFSGKDGELLWQTLKHPTWKVGFFHAGLMQYVPNVEETDALGNHDSIESLLLVVGDSEIALVSRDNGATLSAAAIPYPPHGRTVLGDFNNDGVNDLIILSSDSLFGYSVKVSTSARGMFVAMLVLLFLAAVIFIANIRTETIVDSKLGKRSVLSVVRSTDDAHLD